MCLWKNDEATGEFRRINRNVKEVVVWKVYSVFDGYDDAEEVFSPYKRSGPIKVGKIQSNRNSIDVDWNDGHYGCGGKTIHRGIHVILNRAAARRLASRHKEDRVFRCTAKMSDLVAVGGFDGVDPTCHAVFMKIHISEEDFERGKKRRT